MIRFILKLLLFIIDHIDNNKPKDFIPNYYIEGNTYNIIRDKPVYIYICPIDNKEQELERIDYPIGYPNVI
jgi:hypothetical protein